MRATKNGSLFLNFFLLHKFRVFIFRVLKKGRETFSLVEINPFIIGSYLNRGIAKKRDDARFCSSVDDGEKREREIERRK